MGIYQESTEIQTSFGLLVKDLLNILWYWNFHIIHLPQIYSSDTGQTHKLCKKIGWIGWVGLAWIRLDWIGLVGLVWFSLVLFCFVLLVLFCFVLFCFVLFGLYWIGFDWIDWIAWIDWIGWIGLDWIGLDWNCWNCWRIQRLSLIPVVYLWGKWTLELLAEPISGQNYLCAHKKNFRRMTSHNWDISEDSTLCGSSRVSEGCKVQASTCHNICSCRSYLQCALLYVL